MRQVLAGFLVLAFGAGVAAAQDDRERRVDELKRDFDKSMKALHEKFQAERARLEKEFRAAQEKLGDRGPRKEEPRKEAPKGGLEALVEKLVDRVDRIEKRLDRELPALKERAPEMWKQWRDRIPEWKGRGLTPPDPKEFEKWMPPALKERMERWKKDGGPKGFGDWEEWLPPGFKERLFRWNDRDFDFDFRFKKQDKEDAPRKDHPRKEKNRDKDEDDDDNF
jgi:hypothetical protein